MEKLIDIKKLVPDDHNFNKGTEQGRELVKQSFEKYGAGRSVLLDKDDRLIAGNKATAGDFVTSGQLPEHSVVDMELAYILALGFHNVQATKYVSDNLNYQQYEQTISNQ